MEKDFYCGDFLVRQECSGRWTASYSGLRDYELGVRLGSGERCCFYRENDAETVVLSYFSKGVLYQEVCLKVEERKDHRPENVGIYFKRRDNRWYYLDFIAVDDGKPGLRAQIIVLG